MAVFEITIALLIGLYALPNTFALLQINLEISGLLVPLFLLAFFVVLREMIITGLWHAAQDQLSASTMELDAMSQVAL